MKKKIIDLLKELGPGKISPTAYDSAWVARLDHIDRELSNRALEWLTEHQHPDGSWGAATPFYYHDRVISTLAAMIALTHRGRRARDRQQIEKGLMALEQITSGATKGLMADPNGATAGFEMIVPTLLAEAEELGIIKRQGDKILGRLSKQRQAKLAILKNKKIDRSMTAAFSAEMAGTDAQSMLDLNNIQEQDGSISHSPSATAYYLAKVCPDNSAALAYLRKAIAHDGGTPMALPFEVCERAWVLWNISLVNSLDTETTELCEPHLEKLLSSWKPLRGVGFTRDHSVMDGDDTSLTFDVLSHFGQKVDFETLLQFEEEDHFRCYPLEISYSISTNVHFLGAFRQAGLKPQHPIVQKAIQYLYKTRTSDAFWFDKWHASPYYTTAHTIIVCSNYYNDLIFNSIDWIINNQNKDGSWGFYTSPTAEETAYALQALSTWKNSGGKVDRKILLKGWNWLKEHSEPPYPYLWIAKSLNYSEWIIKAEILSASALVEETLG
ncbi:MAG: cyclase [Chloroflexi bacterium]|nr:cyclase [Chloroflexota bacterium]